MCYISLCAIMTGNMHMDKTLIYSLGPNMNNRFLAYIGLCGLFHKLSSCKLLDMFYVMIKYRVNFHNIFQQWRKRLPYIYGICIIMFM